MWPFHGPSTVLVVGARGHVRVVGNVACRIVSPTVRLPSGMLIVYSMSSSVHNYRNVWPMYVGAKINTLFSLSLYPVELPQGSGSGTDARDSC